MSVTARKWVVSAVILGLVCLSGVSAWTQEKKDPPNPEQETTAENLKRLFSLAVPDDFKPQATDEQGMLRWRKGSAEIGLVAGELFAGSADQLFKALVTSGEEKGEMQEVKILDMKGVKAAIFKEKPAKDPDRLRIWRIIAVGKTRMFSLELSAVEREFPELAAEFEKVAASFQIKEP